MGFGADVDAFLADFKRRADEAVRKVVVEAGHYLVDVTPVITGKLRGGYHVIIDGYGAMPSLPVDPTGQFTKALISAAAQKVQFGNVVEIVNNVYYGFWVDQGTIHFTGRNMIGKTLIYAQGVKL